MTEFEKHEPYVLFMLLLSILSLVCLAFSTIGHLDANQAEILLWADDFVCLLFFIDFLVSIRRAPNKVSYLLRWGWIDLLSCVPMIDALRLTRLGRIFRILRLMRGIKATKILSQFILNRRSESAFLAVALVSLLLVVLCSVGILQFEDSPQSNIRTGEDAIWWAITTITTVAYGDKYPVTSEGRLIASCLMVCGVGLFGTLSGFVASWFLKPQEQAQSAEMLQLLAEVREIRLQLQASRPTTQREAKGGHDEEWRVP